MPRFRWRVTVLARELILLRLRTTLIWVSLVSAFESNGESQDMFSLRPSE